MSLEYLCIEVETHIEDLGSGEMGWWELPLEDGVGVTAVSRAD